MALPSSGTLSLGQIQGEFTNGGQNLRGYFRQGTAVSENSYNGNIPTSGTISVRQFLGAQRVDYVQFYSTASPWGNGSATWTVPVYAETCRVECYGGGASGGGATYGVGWYGGTAGNPSYVNDLGLYAGGGGACAAPAYTTAGGAGGSASGGDTNLTGGAADHGSHYLYPSVPAGTYWGNGGANPGPSGGAGGHANTTCALNDVTTGYGENGFFVGGGGGGGGDYYINSRYWAAGGGAGGYCKKDYARGALNTGVGHTVNYAGVAVPQGQMRGGYGQLGMVQVTWW